MFSMMSVSPDAGHETEGSSTLLPSSQKAGQKPSPTGSFIRALTRPWLKSNLVLVSIRPEVKS